MFDSKLPIHRSIAKIAKGALLIAASILISGARPAPEAVPVTTKDAAERLSTDVGRIAGAAETMARKVKTPEERAFDAASLKAQRDGASWAFIALFISVAQGLIGIVGLIWIKHTLDATREAVETATAANSIAQDGVVAATKATEAQLRAWLSLDVTLEDCSRTAQNAHFAVGITVKNIGATPALNIRCKTDVRLETQNRIHPPRPASFTGPGHILHPLMPNEPTVQKYGERVAQADIDAAYANANQRDTPIVVLDVMLAYRTTFDSPGDEPHMTSARFLITPQWGPNANIQLLRDWLSRPTLSLNIAKITREDFGPAIAT